jgi:hypothetical protein
VGFFISRPQRVDRELHNQLILPELPVIPLGIHTEDFAFTDAQRAAARAALGVAAEVGGGC